ncbi:hypothetical protein QZH41_018569 [Actinostola sp. cb2023]|nr:hypothetical protein QZH41_018569 [Actinostola sp. cb2023]
MSNPASTLTSVWIEGQPSPAKSTPSSPAKRAVGHEGSVVQQSYLKFRESGLETLAREAVVLENNGQIEQAKSSPISLSKVHSNTASMPAGTPTKMSPLILPKAANTPVSSMIMGSPQGQQIISVSNSPRTPATMIAAPIISSPANSWPRVTPGSGRKRRGDFGENNDIMDSAERRKRGKRLPSAGRGPVGDKSGKGLRHFSMKVCEKVQQKGITSYNEVADELVREFSDPEKHMSPTDQVGVSHAYDQKNIRRRVYDALNVLMAMNIISKEKKEIRWIGLPTNSAQECQQLEEEKKERQDRIRQKTAQLQELILQQIAFKNLVQRNRMNEKHQGVPAQSTTIHLPFIIVNTSKKTVIDCSISNDKFEYLFNFDNTFEIHDDIEVLKRMGMAFGLEKKSCSDENLKLSRTMVPKALEPYVVEMAKSGPVGLSSNSINPSTVTSNSGKSPLVAAQVRMSPLPLTNTPSSPLATPLPQGASPLTVTNNCKGTARSSRTSSMASDGVVSHRTVSPCSYPSSPASVSESESSHDGFMDTDEQNSNQ